MNAPLSTQVAVAKSAMGLLLSAGIEPDDPDFQTLLESESDVLETVRRMLRAARMEEADAKKLGEILGEFRDRKSRKEEKADALRRAAAWALEEVGIKRVDAPDFTATLSRGRGAVTITDESALPEAFVRIKREPDKARIREALEEGAAVPGALLSNARPAITLRVR